MDKSDGTYEEGTKATLTASAHEGYEFVNWTDADGKVVSTSNPYTFEVNANTTLKANFKKVEVTPTAPSSKDILDAIIAGNKVPSVIKKGEKELVLPKAPEGYNIKITQVSP